MNKKYIFLVILSGILNLSLYSQVYIPNSFTPNNDGINDYITVFTNDTLDVFELTIHNSWGEVVLYTEDIDFKWSGGEDYYSPSNIYTYVLRHRREGYNFIKTQRGFITLIR